MRPNVVILAVGCFLASSEIYLASAETCHGNVSSPESPRASSPEYARGDPKTIRVLDSGEIREVHYVKLGEFAVYQGDIILGIANEIESASKLGPVDLGSIERKQDQELLHFQPFGNILKRARGLQKWPDATIPFEIDIGLEQSEVIRSAMKTWSSSTPIKFAERNPENRGQYKNYVQFILGKNPHACLSDSIGMRGGKQQVQLVDGCDYGQILHEIGHVIGLEHEMNRRDRDLYVEININNVMKGYENQFAPDPRDIDFGPYDFDSIMHYEPTAFSCNDLPTIVPKRSLPGGIVMGQRDHLSQGDIAAVKDIYK